MFAITGPAPVCAIRPVQLGQQVLGVLGDEVHDMGVNGFEALKDMALRTVTSSLVAVAAALLERCCA